MKTSFIIRCQISPRGPIRQDKTRGLCNALSTEMKPVQGDRGVEEEQF